MNKYAYIVCVILIAQFSMLISPTVYSASCGDPSPSVKNGIDPIISIKSEKLKENEIQQVITLFKLLDGEWEGEAHGVECTGKSGVEERKNEYEVKLAVNLKRRDSIELEFDLELPKKRSTSEFKDRLFLDNGYLMYEGKISGFKAAVLYIKGNFITYLRKLRTGSKGNIPFEYVRTIALYGKDKLMIEDLKYVNGKLAAIQTYELR